MSKDSKQLISYEVLEMDTLFCIRTCLDPIQTVYTRPFWDQIQTGPSSKAIPNGYRQQIRMGSDPLGPV